MNNITHGTKAMHYSSEGLGDEWHSVSTGHVHKLTMHVVFVYLHFTRCTLACKCAYAYCIIMWVYTQLVV